MLGQIKDFFRIATGRDGYAYPSLFWRHSLTGLPKIVSGSLWALYAENCLLHSKNEAVEKMAVKHPVLLYYKAFSLYMRGQFKEALQYVLDFCWKAPHNREGYYLLSDLYTLLNNKKDAFGILNKESLLKRRKTWIKLANLVDDASELEKLQQIHKDAIAKGSISKDDDFILEYVALGAQRANEYDVALDIWKKIEAMGKKGDVSAKRNVNVLFARDAMRALAEASAQAGLEIFLVSGTLLGYMRNGNFLPHDTDLDVGIFDGFSVDTLRSALYSTGCFTIMAKRSPHCMRIRHFNGTAIDIFTHYREQDDYWHAAPKTSWHNSPFALKKVEFLGFETYIPDPPEKYLEENYGKDWRIPKTKFDAAVECPNYKILNEGDYQIYNIKQKLMRK